MNLNRRNKRNAGFMIALGTGLTLIGASPTLAADPVIHVAWDDGPGPYLDTHYTTSTTSPASVAFPDVKLITGSLTSQIWSTDVDNQDDIGVIASPYAAGGMVHACVTMSSTR